MKRGTTFIFAALALGAAAGGLWAQENAVGPPAQEAAASLDRELDRCLGNPDCPVEERLRLMGQLNDGMKETVGAMNQNCMRAGYRDCMGPQSAERERWRRMHAQMGSMMSAMEPSAPAQPEAEKMNKVGPAAGASGPEQRRKKREQKWWSRWMYGNDK